MLAGSFVVHNVVFVCPCCCRGLCYDFDYVISYLKSYDCSGFLTLHIPLPRLDSMRQR